MDSGDLHALNARISALEAELQRWASGAVNSGSEIRADAVCRRLPAFVRLGQGKEQRPSRSARPPLLLPRDFR
jgi:hypothetical protein